MEKLHKLNKRVWNDFREREMENSKLICEKLLQKRERKSAFLPYSDW